MQKSSVNLGFYAKILQGTVSWQYGRAQEHWAFEDFDNHTILTTPTHDSNKVLNGNWIYS